MANQGRARSALSGENIVRGQPNQADYERDSSRGHFTYSPLDTSVDGIRLVILEPSIAMEDVIRCRLSHVTFGQMPKYEALSYTWGSEDLRNSIMLDGKTFLVRENLREALIRLRMPDKERALWIDAICINQDDIPERNQQVRIMPHIYSRAQMVLVWLGLPDKSKILTPWHWVERGSTPGLLQKLSTVDYWNRVWIVQEIGKARRIRIHSGSIVVDWENFIETLRTWCPGCVPLKLADQMQDKYGDGYKLENLLKTHQKALCRDVRDKIYGFTGLANDNYGRLSMDYAKSLFEIWKDVVRFRSADSTIPQHDILQFAGFVRELLGGHLISTTEDVFMNKDDCLFIHNKDQVVHCPARLWGRIAWVGPTYNEIRSNLHKVDEWTAGIKDHVPDRYLRSAYEENDLFLQLLEDMDHSDLDLVFPIHQPPRWYLDYCRGGAFDGGGAFDLMHEIKPKASNMAADNTYGEFSVGNANEDKHLILLDICPCDDASIPGSSKQFTGIGFAPPIAREGDFICYFYQKERAAVVRYSERGHMNRGRGVESFSIIASAVLPNFREMAAAEMKNKEQRKLKFAVLNNAPLRDSETINLYMDLPSVYEWSF